LATAPIDMPRLKLPAPVMAFAVEPKSRGDEDKVLSSLRRLQEEDPTIDLHRDQQTGEQIVAGLSQVHVEVTIDRLRSRFGVEVTLKPPRVPYQETIRASSIGCARADRLLVGHARRLQRDLHAEARARPPMAATRSSRAGAGSSATVTSRSSRWRTRRTRTASSSWTRSRAG
jgi:translation elongation factor EF-G